MPSPPSWIRALARAQGGHVANNWWNCPLDLISHVDVETKVLCNKGPPLHHPLHQSPVKVYLQYHGTCAMLMATPLMMMLTHQFEGLFLYVRQSCVHDVQLQLLQLPVVANSYPAIRQFGFASTKAPVLDVLMQLRRRSRQCQACKQMQHRHSYAPFGASSQIRMTSFICSLSWRAGRSPRAEYSSRRRCAWCK